MSVKVEKFMSDEEVAVLGVTEMSAKQKKLLMEWGMKMNSLGQHVVADIEAVKYDGRLIILSDGSRWEVDEIDSSTSEFWDFLDKVVIIDGEMYKLDESEKVMVEEDY